MNTPALFLLRALVLTTTVGLAACTPLSASEAIHWNHVALDTTARALPLDPISESRILAIVHLAMHDAANSVSPRFATYGARLAVDEDASVDAAIAAAAHATLRDLLPGQAAALDAEYDGRLHALRHQPTKARGVAIGERAAAQLLALRRNDGADATTAYTPGGRPGDYRPTPPDFTPAVHSHWGRVKPFALTSSEQFRPVPPPAPGSASALADLAEVRAIGGVSSDRRTFEQSEIASYWYEASTQGWNRIAREIAVTQCRDVWEQARLLALANVAMADGFIAGFEAKYHYNYWRPATAVRAQGDENWLSFLPTPPVPDYPSTHTVLGAAAATAMARCLQTDYISFTMTSGAPYPNITRRFWSLSQAAQENGSSRVFAGLHFSTAVQAGYRQGTDIGAWAAAHLLLPREREGTVRLTARN